MRMRTRRGVAVAVVCIGMALDVPTGAITKVSSNPMYGSGPDHAWSPDSKWLAYTRNTTQYMDTVQLYSIEQKKSFALTDDVADARRPVFDPNGK